MPFPVDIGFIHRTESKLGRKLPSEYAIRLCLENGGEISTNVDVWQLHPIFDDSDRTRLKRTWNNIIRETAAAHDWPNFPTDAVCIGDNGGGDRLILLPADDARYDNAVYWWDHETGEIEQIANNFAELTDPAKRSL